MKCKCIFCGEIKELINIDGMCLKCEKDLMDELEQQRKEDFEEYNSIVWEGLRELGRDISV
ncbi:Uncharacterised protein [[Clostridium] sordellii]|uniref:hypothetical protein n=1 Tax=Paraclostridium sordellii TaxID=1505 RepID=UPI0005EA62B2|nr:hypothetical protein [Paeniclostridium sordellii]CEQ01678.1 Uncharacterised protein [[Clostridium] sordellii] [Paeniclostridium sordellii]